MVRPEMLQTIVIGHRNPDMDSICSALAYAELKRAQGIENVTAARAGATNERVDFVLQKFGFEPPPLISDLSPKVSDVMQRKVISVRAHTTVYEALQLIERQQLRGLPVVDDQNRCLGLLSAFKLSHHLFPPREEAASARMVTASLRDIVETFGGKIVMGTVSDEPADQLLMVAAMARESLLPRLRKYRRESIILFVGDRPEIQDQAIAEGVGAIVVTGGFSLEDELQERAVAKGVPIIISPYDTATSVLLARGAVRVQEVIFEDYMGFDADTPLEEARARAAESAGFVFPVSDEDGALVGILSKSDFLKPPARQLVLVDHNELTQAVKGADKVPVIEVLDHHKLGGFASSSPILFWNNPVGSTSTIVAMCYQQAGVPIPAPVAGLLMAGLISDTLNLTSPTSTPVDRTILAQLAAITGVDSTALSEQIFSVGSPLLTMTPEQAIAADCKLYEEDGSRFTVAQIEELTFAHFDERREALLAALEAHRRRENLLFATLLVTDINTQSSLLLAHGREEFLATIDYPSAGPHLWELSGVVSRKKQLLPYLLQCIARMR